MKLGDLKLNVRKTGGSTDRISEFIKGNTIISAFEKAASKHPDKNAIYDGIEWMSYIELKNSADSVAAFIYKSGIKKGSFITIMMERKNMAVALMLGIMKAGCAYVPLDPELPVKRLTDIILQCESPLLFFSSPYIRNANTLQWSSPVLKNICCADSDDFSSVIEPTGEIMDESLWNAVAENANTAVQAGGWKDPYTGEWISEEIMDSFSVNVFEKLKSFTSGDKNIMEIGTASGLSLKRLAPICGRYVATDISSSMLEFLKSTISDKFKNVETVHTPAHGIDTLNPDKFDVIIINSVAQSFPGLNYMRDVMKKCDDMLRDGGVIFLGNIYDAAKKADFEKSFAQYKLMHPEAPAKTHFDSELFFHKDFFTDWATINSYVPEFSETNVNADFFSYGYDVVLRKTVDAKASAPLKKQYCKSDFKPSTAVDMSENSGNAYAIFTSGTTGVPKGVQIPHISVLNLAETMQGLIFKNEEVRTGVFPSFSFDPSVQQIFPALIFGSEVVIIPENVRRDPVELYNFISENNIQFIDLTPPMASVFAGYAIENDLECPLSHLIVGGEVFQKSLAKDILRWGRTLNLINAYGPTECCVSATYYKVDAEVLDKLPALPIGSPVKNTEILIFDDLGNPVPEGLQGEICVSGPGVSNGYINDEALTKMKFSTHPFDPSRKVYRTGDKGREHSPNLFLFTGRKDSQVKIRGYRIELEDIRVSALKLPEINECVVVCRDFSENGSSSAALYFVSDTVQDVQHLKATLVDSLPEYMIPEFFIQLDKMPLNSNGKIDLTSLPAPAVGSNNKISGEKPSTENQIKIANFFCQLTGINSWTIDDNFLDSGGNSILSVRLISLIQQKFGMRIPLTYLMKYPTIRLLTAYLELERVPEIYTPLIPISSSNPDTRCNLYCFHPVGGNSFCYHHLSAALQNIYNMTMIQAPGLAGDSKPLSNCLDMGALYSSEILKDHPDKPKVLIGWSHGGLVAYETACQMYEKGEKPKGLVIIDMTSGNNLITDEMVSTQAGMNRIFIDMLGLTDIDPDKATREELREKVLQEGERSGFFPKNMGSELGDRLLSVAMANAESTVTYEPKKYDGEVLLIRASEITRSSFIDTNEDSFLGWKRYVNNITLKWADATHETILSAENIPQLARFIKDFIERLG